MNTLCSSSRRVFKSPCKQEQFERDGFVIVEAMTRREALDLRDMALALIDPKTPINDPQGALYGTLFDDPRRIKGSALADNIIGPLLDAHLDNFRYEGGYVVAKPGISERLVMHQHQPVTPDIYEPAVHCWVTLDDCGTSAGALRIVRGSHAITRHVQSFDSPPYFADFADRLESHYAKALEMRAGQAVIFERSLLHGSENNGTGRPLIRLLGTAIPEESTLCILSEGITGQFEALKVGDHQIDADLYCIAKDNRAGLKSIGRIENQNVELNEDEFRALLNARRRIARGFDPLDEVRKRQIGV